MTDPVYTALLDIKQDIGALKASNEALSDKIEQSLLAQRACDARVAVLENSRQRQIGSTRVWSLIGTAIGACVGFLVTLFAHK